MLSFSFFLFLTMAFRILVPHLGVKPVHPVVEPQSPNHWTAGEFRIMLNREKLLGPVRLLKYFYLVTYFYKSLS